MSLKTKFIIFFFLCVVRSDELSDALEQAVRNDIVPGLETLVTHELLTLGITQFAHKDNLALYQNRDTFAIEVQPFVPVYNPVKAPTKEQIDQMSIEQRPIAHETFLSSAKFFKDLFLVDNQIYTLFNNQIGIQPKPNLTERQNLKGFLYSKNKQDNQFLNVRLYIARDFKMTELTDTNKEIASKRFKGPRIGACTYDNEVMERFEKAQTTKGYMTQLSNLATPARGQNYSFEYNISLQPITKEVFIFYDLAAIDAHQKDKLELLANQSMLALSRTMLNGLGNIGYYNDDDSCFFSFGMTAYDTSSNFRDYFTFNTQYLKKYKIFHLEDNSVLKSKVDRNNPIAKKRNPIKYLSEVRNQCERVVDNIFSWDYLGKRVKGKDRREGNVIFRAYEKENNINFVYTYNSQVGFGSEAIIGAAKRLIVEWTRCFYHDDTHFINMEFGEIYLIVFTFDLNSGIQLPQSPSHSIIEEKKEAQIVFNDIDSPVQSTRQRKQALKPALPAFSNLKRKAAAELDQFDQGTQKIAHSNKQIVPKKQNHFMSAAKPTKITFGMNESKSTMKFLI